MSRRQVLTDVALSPVAGYLATKAMEPVSMLLYEPESDADRQREDAVRPAPPYRIAAEKTAALAGRQLSEDQSNKASLVFHYGLAISWAPLYPLLSRRAGLSPTAAGLGTGATMSLIADELMTPALEFSAPNGNYPLATHVRGLVAHLAFGLVVAAVYEAAWAFLRGRTTSA